MRPDPAAASRLPAYRALAVTVVTLALAYGVWYAYSVFLVALLREFGWSRSVLAGAFSLFTLVSGGAGPVLGALADRFGPRRLILMGGGQQRPPTIRITPEVRKLIQFNKGP